MTTVEVLCSYSSVKGHRTRCEREIANLLELLQAQYLATSELRLNDRLKKLEKHSHRSLDIAEYLVCIKYPKACDHSEKVKEFMESLAKCSTDVYTDHRPLEGVFQKDIFDLASLRLQRLREKVAMYSFRVCWVPGKTYLI